MYEQVQVARTFLRMAWLYRWVGLATAIVACTLGWAGVQLMPDQYEVSAKVYLDSRSMLRPLLRGIAFDSGDLSNTTMLLSRTLLTRPNLEEVARRTDLDLGTKTPEEFDKLIADLSSDVSIVGTTRDNIYEIKYSNEKPKVAKAVVDELLNTFMESALGDTRRETAVTQKFLEEQIAAYEKRLVEAEERLKAFKQRNVGVMPGSQGGFFSRLEQAHTELKEAQLQLEEGMRRRDQLKEQAKNASSAVEDPFALDDDLAAEEVDGAIAQYEGKIAELNNRIDDLLVSYTEKHPDIVAMRKMIEDFKAKIETRKQELAKEAKEKPPVAEEQEDDFAAMMGNPFKQQLQLQAAEADAMVAGLQTRVQEFERRVKELEKRVDTVPEVEAELARLNRDYEVNKTQYDELLKRRELAYMAQEADQSEDDVKVKIIEPPRVPLLPTGPNRLLFSSIVLIVGLGIGGALSALLSQMNPRIIDVPDLKDITGLPVIGVISLTSSPLHRQQRRYELMAFSAALAGLVLVYVGQVVMFVMGIDLHGKISSVIGMIA
ncbi:MAG TPA: chain length-determining protein [Gammaproteobacteria bacterium]|nr:chain length-determining protein [Gammaproteobacteria bacterium]